ncbi:hypothetical protein ACFL4G_05525 [Thermodesulfobacteriota bacterium]
MSTTCKVLAEVFVEMASHPTTPWYLCSYSGGNPAICATSAAYNSLLRDPTFKAVNKKAAALGCTVAVKAAEEVYQIVIVEGAETAQDIDRAIGYGRQLHHALNTRSGIHWLMSVLSGMY